MPPTIMAVATNLRASIPLPGLHSSNLGAIRLRIRANITTKIGRLPIMVETSDTGPFCNAQKDSIAPDRARVSLRTIRPMVDFLCFILLSWLKVWGRIEMSRKIPDRQNVLVQSKFQTEM